MLDRLQDGKPHPISQAEYEQFYDVLPPVCMATQYDGARWDFGFAEGADNVYLFRRQGSRHFAVKTPYLNPYEAGGFEIQKRRWVLKWIELAKRSGLFTQAGRPRIDTQTFHECVSDQELLAEVQQEHWHAGRALFVGNLCFVKLTTDSDEWLAFKGGSELGRTSFRTIIYVAGIEGAQEYLDRLRQAPARSSDASRGRRRQ